MTRSWDRKIYFIVSVLWVVLIYSTLYIARPICDFLQENTPFNKLINISLSAFFVFIIIIFLKKARPRKLSTYILLVFTGCLYLVVFKYIKHPEEKMHLVQYGILAFLIYKALSFKLKGYWPYFIAFLLTSLIGWGDELIQGALPNRYYQTTDVILNVISGMLGLFFFFSLTFRTRNK